MRRAFLVLAAYCELSASRRSASIPLFDLMAAVGQVCPDTSKEEPALALLRARGLILLHQGEEQEGRRASEIEPCPEIRIAFPDVCERVGRCRDVLEQASAIGTAGHTDRVHRVLREAALCFNAGLFFEAHEHLEHVWISLPHGPIRNTLQGVIQVSVGFHHAERGSYDGAINQLAKGLGKLAAGGTEVAGLKLKEFVGDVSAARQRIVVQGREEMRPIMLPDAPRIRFGN